MNSAERVIEVLNGRIPDRVPYAEMFIDEKVIDKISPGMSYEDFADYANMDIVTLIRKMDCGWTNGGLSRRMTATCCR